MPRVASRLIFVVALLLCTSLSSFAFAQKSTSKAKMKEALELIQGANDDYDSGDYKYALDGYKEAHAIYPDPVLLYRIGLSYEKLKNNREATTWFKRYLDEGKDKSTIAKINKKLPKLSASLSPQITIESTPDGAKVFVNDPNEEAIGETPITFELEPGEYKFILTKDGYRTGELNSTVKNGDDLKLTSELKPLKGGDDSFLISDNDSSVKKIEEPGKPSSVLTTVGWISLGTGIAGLAAGGVLTLLSQSKTTDVNSYNKRAESASQRELTELKDSATSLYELSLASYIVGGVLAGTGVTLLLVDSGGSSEADAQAWKFNAVPTQGGGYVGVSTEF